MTEAARGLKQKPAPEDDPNVWSEYEIEAHTSLVDRPLRTLKHGDAFAAVPATSARSMVRQKDCSIATRASSPISRCGSMENVRCS
jgi:hypothetical protein